MSKKRLVLLLCILCMLLSAASCAKVEPIDPDVPEKQENAGTETIEKEPTSNENKEEETETPSDETEDEPETQPENKPKPLSENNTVETPPSDRNEDSSNRTTVSNWSSEDLTAEEIEALLNDPYMILVNQKNKVSSNYKPMDMTTYAGYQLNRTCANALRDLINAGKKAGYTYTLYSGYRTYTTQYNKYYNKIAFYKNKGYSEEKAIELTDQYYAQPGASEHHTGLAADVCIARIVNQYACLHENYDQTPEFRWFSAHAHEYGFILRYGKTQKSITGYNYEPWHYRYVGVDVASEIYRRGITYEEFIWGLQERLAELKG